MENIANSKNGSSLANNPKEPGYFPVIKGGSWEMILLGLFLALLAPCGLNLDDLIHSESFCFYLGPSEDTVCWDIVRFNQLSFKDRKILE